MALTASQLRRNPTEIIVRPAGQSTATTQSAPPASPPADVLAALTNDIRVWKIATVVLGSAVVYFAASAWWRGRTVTKVRGQLSGAQAEAQRRREAMAAAAHALR